MARSDESCSISNDVDGLVHVDVTVTHTLYLNTIADQLHRFWATVCPGCSGHFQQDILLCHTAKTAQEWCERHDDIFKVLSWLENSPDVSPKKHLQDGLEKQV